MRGTQTSRPAAAILTGCVSEYLSAFARHKQQTVILLHSAQHDRRASAVLPARYGQLSLCPKCSISCGAQGQNIGGLPMADEKHGQPVEFMLSPNDLEKLKSAQGTTISIKGIVRDGKLTVTGIQHEFNSPYMHNWPPGPPPDDD